MIQISLQAVQAGVIDGPNGSKLLTFADPASGISVVVPVDQDALDGIVRALKGSPLVVAAPQVPSSVLRNGHPG